MNGKVSKEQGLKDDGSKEQGLQDDGHAGGEDGIEEKRGPRTSGERGEKQTEAKASIAVRNSFHLLDEMASEQELLDDTDSPRLMGGETSSSSSSSSKGKNGRRRGRELDNSKTQDEEKRGIRGGAHKKELYNVDIQKYSDKYDDASSFKLPFPLVWIDLEMTGLDPEKDRILEIAVVVTNGKLTKAVEGPELVINEPDDVLAKMNEWCLEHHKASGLSDRVRSSETTLAAAEEEVLKFIERYTKKGMAQMAGNSIYVDFMFIKRHMPRLADHFSHVVLDVSSIGAICKRWYPKVHEKTPAKINSHRAMDDVWESIGELLYLRRNIFKP